MFSFLRSQKYFSERLTALTFDELLDERRSMSGDMVLIVFCVGDKSIADPAVGIRFEQILDRHPTVPFVILSESDDPEEGRRAFAAGARGFVPSLLKPPLLCAALDLVRAGGKFVPAELFDELSRRRNDLKTKDGALTQRQTDVLQLLLQGSSNKVIGAQLGLTESTVKVHMRRIMYHLGAKNRTEAALLAQRHL